MWQWQLPRWDEISLAGIILRITIQRMLIPAAFNSERWREFTRATDLTARLTTTSINTKGDMVQWGMKGERNRGKCPTINRSTRWALKLPCRWQPVSHLYQVNWYIRLCEFSDYRLVCSIRITSSRLSIHLSAYLLIKSIYPPFLPRTTHLSKE